MTDRLQQKAAEIVREQLGYQVPASLESMRVDHPYEYKCALAGLTAGIAMAAEREQELQELAEISKEAEVTHEIHDTESKGMDYCHQCWLKTVNRERFMVASANYVRRALAKGETQPAGNATKQQMEERWHCDDL